jgi:arylsulfatase A-like enzyme
MPFPRGKSTLYEFGTHEPMAVRWPGHAVAGMRVTDLVSLMDLCPTFLEAAGVQAPPEVAADMAGKSLIPEIIAGKSGLIIADRDRIYVGNERHARSRAGLVGYPRRGIRTTEYLYLHNVIPDRWPAGDPPAYGDVDPADGSTGDGLSKDFLLAHATDEKYRHHFDLAFAKQPAEELYELKTDPHEEHNLAADPKYQDIKSKLSADLENYLEKTHDPRCKTSTTKPAFDDYHYFGGTGAYGSDPKK